MRLIELAAKTKQLVGLVMMVVAVPAIGAAVLEWQRGSNVRILAIIYSLAGVYLAYEGFRLLRGK